MATKKHVRQLQKYVPNFTQWGNIQLQEEAGQEEAERMRQLENARRERENARREREILIDAARQNIEEAKARIAKADVILSASLDANERQNAHDEREDAITLMQENKATWNRLEHERSPTQFKMDDILGGSSKRRGTKKHQKGRKTRKTRKGKRGRKSKKARRLAKPSKRCKRVSRRR